MSVQTLEKRAHARCGQILVPHPEDFAGLLAVQVDVLAPPARGQDHGQAQPSAKPRAAVLEESPARKNFRRSLAQKHESVIWHGLEISLDMRRTQEARHGPELLSRPFAAAVEDIDPHRPAHHETQQAKPFIRTLLQTPERPDRQLGPQGFVSGKSLRPDHVFGERDVVHLHGAQHRDDALGIVLHHVPLQKIRDESAAQTRPSHQRPEDVRIISCNLERRRRRSGVLRSLPPGLLPGLFPDLAFRARPSGAIAFERRREPLAGRAFQCRNGTSLSTKHLPVRAGQKALEPEFQPDGIAGLDNGKARRLALPDKPLPEGRSCRFGPLVHGDLDPFQPLAEQPCPPGLLSPKELHDKIVVQPPLHNGTAFLPRRKKPEDRFRIQPRIGFGMSDRHRLRVRPDCERFVGGHADAVGDGSKLLKREHPDELHVRKNLDERFLFAEHPAGHGNAEPVPEPAAQTFAHRPPSVVEVPVALKPDRTAVVEAFDAKLPLELGRQHAVGYAPETARHQFFGTAVAAACNRGLETVQALIERTSCDSGQTLKASAVIRGVENLRGLGHAQHREHRRPCSQQGRLGLALHEPEALRRQCVADSPPDVDRRRSRHPATVAKVFHEIESSSAAAPEKLRHRHLERVLRVLGRNRVRKPGKPLRSPAHHLEQPHRLSGATSLSAVHVVQVGRRTALLDDHAPERLLFRMRSASRSAGMKSRLQGSTETIASAMTLMEISRRHAGSRQPSWGRMNMKETSTVVLRAARPQTTAFSFGMSNHSKRGLEKTRPCTFPLQFQEAAT